MEVHVEARWRKSSYSGNGGGTCVEVGEGRHRVLVRDTKQNGAGPILRFSPAVWRRFAAQVKRSLAAGPHRVHGRPCSAKTCAGARDTARSAVSAAASSVRAAARSAAVPASSLPGTMRTMVPTHEFLTWLTARSRRLHYSVGMTITDAVQDAIGKVPVEAWTAAYDGGGKIRHGTWMADITGLLDMGSWSAGMRVIVRKERPHPGAQLRFTDIDGHRFTALATNTKRGQLAGLELRLRRRARCEDRIRNAKDTGLRNLPLKGFAQNQASCEVVAGPASCWPGPRRSP